MYTATYLPLDVHWPQQSNIIDQNLARTEFNNAIMSGDEAINTDLLFNLLSAGTWERMMKRNVYECQVYPFKNTLHTITI